MCRAGGRRCPNAGGRSTQNTRKAVSRARAALRAARAAGDGEAIDAARQRLDAARAAHREAKAAGHRHDAAGHGGDVTAARVLRLPAGQPSARPLGDGSMGDTELVTYPDGTRLVRKRNGSKAEACGADPVRLTDAEDLAPHVMAAVGLPYAAVHRTAPDEVLMEYVEGRSGTHLTGGRHVPDDYTDSPDGRLLGLLDHITANRDRNSDNWIRTDQGRLVGIDHGDAFNGDVFTTSPFARTLYDHSDRIPTLRDNNEFSPADMDRLGRRLQALRPQFERRGRADWHDAMMRRHREVAARATGTTDLITDHTTGREGDVTPPTTTGAHVGGHYNVVHGTVHGTVHQYDGDIVHGDITTYVNHGSSRPDTGTDWLDTDRGAIHQSRHHYHRDRHTVTVHGHHIRNTGSHDTPDHAGDVTPPTTTGDTTNRSSTQDIRTHRHGGLVIRNTNNVSGNARVGSQHDVYYADSRPASRTRPTAGEDRDVTDHDRDDDTTADDRRGTRNTASGNDHVDQQIGFTAADLRRLRRR
ncbi:hypothetical protein ACFV4N_32450 [Actinosynnema sp. NPDC059797]